MTPIGAAEEWPLHALVAEALGWTHLRCSLADATTQWGVNPSGRYRIMWDNLRLDLVPRYDQDWRATGPLIERYRLAVWSNAPMVGLVDHVTWMCNSDRNGLQLPGSETGETPLIAACRVVLALHAAGKLEATT